MTPWTGPPLRLGGRAAAAARPPCFRRAARAGGLLPAPARGPGEVYLVRVADAIGPGTAEFIHHSLKKAELDRAGCVVIELDTPGGLAESMRRIVQDILASPVPVVVYVAPGGARAASAGVMITLAADIAAMAPGTNIGAAHPVGAGGQEIDGTMSEKVVNDMVGQRPQRRRAPRPQRRSGWSARSARASRPPRPRRCGSTWST